MNQLSRGRILLVDDDRRVASALQELLEQRYLFEVRTAHTVEEATRELVLDRFDVVVVDWILPDGNGRDVLRHIQRFALDSAVIVFSAHPSSDSESTGAGAMQFVEKGPDTLALRNAVERGMEEVKRKREQITARAAEPVEDQFWQGMIDEYGPGLQSNDSHTFVSSESETLSYGLGCFIAHSRPAKNRVTAEIDCARYAQSNYEEVAANLYGRVSLSSGREPEFQRGILDTPIPTTLIFRNAHCLPRPIQQEVAGNFRLNYFRRIGSDRKLELNVRLIITAPLPSESNAPIGAIDESFFDLVGTNRISIPSMESDPNIGKKLFSRFISRQFGGRTVIGQSVECLFPRLKLQSHLLSLKYAVEMLEAESIRDDQGSQVLEIEQVSAPVLGSLLIKREAQGTRLAKWSEFGKESKGLYVCRVLSQTNGNIKEASRISGLNRNVIYKTLKEFGIDGKIFRKQPEQQKNFFSELENNQTAAT